MTRSRKIKNLIKRIIFIIRFNLRQLVGGDRMRPSFMIVGAQKAGTTSLYHYLIQHPQIKSALKKEVNYFDKNYYKPESWYQSFFPLKTKNNVITGEATPYYMFHPLAMKRMATYNPDMKIIVLLREPASRAISHYYHEVRKGREPLDMREAFDNEEIRLKDEVEKIKNSTQYPGYNHQRYSYKSRGLYDDQINDMKKHFKDENIMIIDSKDFFKQTQDTVKKVLNFIEVDPKFKIKTKKKFNVGTYAKDPNENEIYTNLKTFYKEPNENLYRSIGKKFNWD